MPYATIDDFKTAIGVDDTIDDANIQRAIDAAATWIENYTGRVFSPQDTLDSTRTFDCPNPNNALPTSLGVPFGWFFGVAGSSGFDRLTVPDVGSVSSIALDLALDGSFSTSLPSGAWMLYPLGVGTPTVIGNYTEIRLRPTAPYAFWPGYQVRVTGKWGWPATDPTVNPIRLANILLANRYFRRPSAPFAIWEGPQMGQLATLPQNDPDVVQLLDAYVLNGQSPNWVMV